MAGKSKFPLKKRAQWFWRDQKAALKSHRYTVFISLAVTLMSLAGFGAINFSKSAKSALVLLDNFEARTLDARFQTRGTLKPAPEVVIVAIDQKTIDRLSWPFARSNYARMLDTLARDGARVVGFDVDFPFPDRSSGVKLLTELEQEYRRSHRETSAEGFANRLQTLKAQSDTDAQFTNSIKNAGMVVLGHLFFTDRADIKHMDAEQVKAYDEVLAFQAYPQVYKAKKDGSDSFPFKLESPDGVGIEPNLRIFAEAAKSYGAFNFDADNDGTFRKATLIFHYLGSSEDQADEGFYPSLDIQMARIFLGADDQQTKLWFNINGPELLELGAKKIHPDVAGRVLINYAGPANTFPYYSLVDVAEGATPPNTFKDKIVVVGATATAVGDMRPIPFTKESYPGVEIHANVLDNILHDRFLKRGINEELTDFWVLLFCGLVMGFLFVVSRPAISTLLFVIAVIGFLGFVYHAFSADGRWLSLVLPFSTLSFNYLGVVSYRVLFEEKEKRKVRGAFSQYVAPGYIAEILKDPGRLQLGGEEVELTVMFSDIRSFTTISEGLTPPALVELLNEYLTKMTDIVIENRGTLDKYIGDALMAFWGRPYLDLPDHAIWACRAALAMKQGLKQLNEGWAAQSKPPLRVGIGINTGPMMVGNMGSKLRFNYTVMGDHVNLGSRIEGLTKEYGTQILLTEFTHQKIGQQFLTRELDLIRVKGKKQPVAVYELLGLASDHARYEDLLGNFAMGLAKYKAGEWHEALPIFEKLAERYPDDGPTKLFVKRCHTFLSEAPEGVWDGVFTMTTK